MPVTNDEIYAYLVDLSANIAQKFADLEKSIILDFANTDNYLLDLSANLTTGFIGVNAKLDVISADVIAVNDYLESEINPVILSTQAEVGAGNDQLKAELDALSQQVTDDVIVELLIIDEELKSLNNQIYEKISQQTDDINTNTNTALSQYTNTINTNTNESVATAVEILQK